MANTTKEVKTNSKSNNNKNTNEQKTEQKTPSTRAKRKKFDKDTPIECMSVVHGGLIYNAISGLRYEWAGYGDVRELPYSDIISLKSKKSRFLYEPWIIIKDKDLLNEDSYQRDFAEIYKFYEEFDDASNFFDCEPANMREKLAKAPEGFKELIVSTASELINNGDLDSIVMINTIDDMLGTNLKMLIN